MPAGRPDPSRGAACTVARRPRTTRGAGTAGAPANARNHHNAAPAAATRTRRMSSNGLTFHHPVAFWLGCALLVAGVLGHFPMFLMAAEMHYHMAGMPMDRPMLLGMIAIPVGLVLATYGLMPRLGSPRPVATGAQLHFHVADALPLNREHWKLVAVLVVALIVDVMKPATLGFVVPGMSDEYGISKRHASLLALVALTGTTVGSVAWGRIADRFGRRSAILLSAGISPSVIRRCVFTP